MIGKALDLKRGGDRYIHTAAYGHFGRSDRPDVSARGGSGALWVAQEVAVGGRLLPGCSFCSQPSNCGSSAASWGHAGAHPSCLVAPLFLLPLLLQVFTWEKVLPLKDA